MRFSMVLLCVYFILWTGAIAVETVPSPPLTISIADIDIIRAQMKVILLLLGLATTLISFIFLFAVNNINKKIEVLNKLVIELLRDRLHVTKAED